MKKLFVCMLILFYAVGLSGCKSKTTLSPDNPVTLTMWHVYGEQADSPMNRLVDQFNETVGKEKGIIIDVAVVTNSLVLHTQLLDAHTNKPGSPRMPDLFSCHPNIVKLLGAEQLLDWQDYFSEEELSHFVDEFIQDGMVENRLAVFPVSKSSFACLSTVRSLTAFLPIPAFPTATLPIGTAFLTPPPAITNGREEKPSAALTI